MFPVANLLAPTLRVAVALDPFALSGIAPKVVPPRVNVAVPAGAAVPLAGLTVAVRVVLCVAEILAGFAVSVVVVLTVALATITVAEAEDPLKVALPP